LNMRFELIWSDEIKKELNKLDNLLAKRVFEKIIWANENNSLFLEAVKGTSFFRYRIGHYRVFFEKGPENALFVLHLRHRSVAYKKMKNK
jgi:mRNA-degrading endonuclease RelE of RelBE toxin-antitoxin system